MSESEVKLWQQLMHSGNPGSGTTGNEYHLREALAFSNAVIMQNQGIVAVGNTLRDAFDNPMSVEYAAILNIYGKIVGDLVELPAAEVRGIGKYVLEEYGQK
jgi:ribulose-5-phosphate 4-epimerase/fuculose-1-phosphate aldolase